MLHRNCTRVKLLSEEQVVKITIPDEKDSVALCLTLMGELDRNLKLRDTNMAKIESGSRRPTASCLSRCAGRSAGR